MERMVELYVLLFMSVIMSEWLDNLNVKRLVDEVSIESEKKTI